ncbi:MAG: hypothetical protein IH852_00345 [Bacteroidetes bacterium]|nr:hypothetical protein [Bacteroidota bacterium]
MDTLTFLTSFLGGGILGALINWARAERSEKKEREINSLEKQIRELYGPLYYFISQAEKLFELNKKFHNAYQKEYIDTEYSQDEGTRKILDEETSQTLGIANKYISYVQSNNSKIKEVLDKSYPFIDPEDIEIFLMFFEHHIRLNTERDEEGILNTPLRIYKHIGDISFLRPEVIKRIKEKFLSKKERLEKLLKK